jgi:undecaprenyl-diphosphatase
LIFVNPSSGPKATGAAELTARFANAHVEECAPDTFVERIEELAGTNIEYIGVAGGDGSIRCVAEHLVAEGGTPSLLAIPAGTRNHFAKDVGIADLDAAQAAAKALFTRWIDVGDVNGHVFVNNSSIGVYPRLVVHRERTERRHSKRVAALLAAWHQLREGRKLSVDVDGEHVRAWLVFVGNGCYGDSLLDLTGREHLDRNELDVRIAHAEGKLSRLRIATAVLFGRLDRSPLIDRRVCREVTLDLGARPIAVALDGEVEMIRSPLRYVSNAQALSVVVRPDAP